MFELVYGAGANAIPMAFALPGSQFVGIDLSRVEVDEGWGTVQSLGLRNIELKRLSILDAGPDLGKFDYIICHGVYSWVPSLVQQRILEICESLLQPQGVAYVSYNTYPGWHMRGMIRDMMLYHAREISSGRF